MDVVLIKTRITIKATNLLVKLAGQEGANFRSLFSLPIKFDKLVKSCIIIDIVKTHGKGGALCL